MQVECFASAGIPVGVFESEISVDTRGGRYTMPLGKPTNGTTKFWLFSFVCSNF